MKNLKILALVTMLALGLTLSAQAQSQNTTTPDQYTTQPTDQTSSAPAVTNDNDTSMQQSQSSVTNPGVDNDSRYATTINNHDKRDPQSETNRLQEIENDSGGN